MAARPKGFGMVAELQQNNNANYDSEMERDVVNWMGEVTGDKLIVSG